MQTKCAGLRGGAQIEVQGIKIMQELNSVEIQQVAGAARTPTPEQMNRRSHIAGAVEGVALGAVVGAWDGVQIGALDTGSLLMPIGELVGLGAGAAIGATYGGFYGLDQGHDVIMALAANFAKTATSQGVFVPGGIISL